VQRSDDANPTSQPDFAGFRVSWLRLMSGYCPNRIKENRRKLCLHHHRFEKLPIALMKFFAYG
jgi:hypothetical protein